jgi:hypothetical protein
MIYIIYRYNKDKYFMANKKLRIHIKLKIEQQKHD